MNIKIEQRVLKVGEKFVLQKQNNPTVRSIAHEFGWSKSTIHKDVTERLQECDKSLYDEVNDIIQKNKDERNIRGGNATKKKYLSHKKITTK